MSSTTVHSQQGDSKQGGALFLLPSEIRILIYRFVVKGRYLVDKPTRECEYSDSEPDLDRSAAPYLSILHVSKSVSNEATAILYSDSVFRFVIRLINNFDEEIWRLKKVASMMQNVILDVDTMSVEIANNYQTWGDDKYAKMLERSWTRVDLFGGVDINRRSLHIRFDGIPKATTTIMACQRLKNLAGFRVATIRVIPLRRFVEYPDHYGLDATEPGKGIRDWVCRCTKAIAGRLAPDFGPAIFGFKSDAGNASIGNGPLFSHGDINLVGWLEFHPRKYQAEESTEEE